MNRIRLAAALAAILIAGFAFAEPMHVYLTYSGAPETTIDINVIIPEKAEVVDVYYDTVTRDGKPESYAQHVTAVYHQTLMELSDRRAVFVAALKDLKPGTEYYFVAGDAEYGLSRERKFRTLPGGDAPLRFVNGGDMGVDGLVIPLLTLAGKQDPDFGVIGGDIAYVNGLLGGFPKWDQWLKNWDELLVTTDGRMVPMVMAIGNHETNRYETTDLTMRSPWYSSLFGRQGEHVYYYTRQFGNNMVFFFLDSGHLVTHEAQAGWLREEMAKYKDVPHRFAAYHVPLYPAHRDYEGAGSAMGRQHWLPIFDEFNLTVGFEHHDHVFKRTKPLCANKVDPTGTVYVGDGCFGRDARTIDPQLRWYNEKEQAVAHFWVVDVTKDALSFKAIDPQGSTIDSFELN